MFRGATSSRSRLSRGLAIVSAAAPPFDPSQLALGGWWRERTTAPWAGAASAGVSGTENLSTVGSSAGTPLNTHATASYASTSDVSAGTLAAFMTNDAFSGAVLFKATAASADAGASTPFENDPIAGASASAIWGIEFSTAGVGVWMYDGAWHTVRAACATGAWHLVQWKYDGTTLHVRLDGGAWGTVAVTSGFGGFALSGQHFALGKNAILTGFTGLIADVMLSPAVLADATFDEIRTYCNTRYGVSV